MNYLKLILAVCVFYAPVLAIDTRYYYRRPTASAVGPIEFVAAAGNNFAATRSPTVNYPTCAANDILLAIFCADGTAAFGGSKAGWALLGSDTDILPDQTGAVFWKKADGSESGVSDPWTNIMDTNETGRVIVLAYRNCSTTSPINASNVSDRGSATAADTTSITPSVNNCMIVGAFTIDPGATPRTFAWDAGITERIDYGTTPTAQNGSDAGIYVGDKLQTTAAASTLGGDFDGAEHSTAIAIALAPL